MSNSLPSIGVVTTSTNALSRGYLAFLACIDSWSKWADQIVVVDGGTTDQSYNVLKAWTSKSNWQVYSSPQTLWGTHDRWHAAQWSVNTNVGIQQLNTDWAFVVCADYILDLSTIEAARKTLANNKTVLAVNYNRVKLTRNGSQYLSPLQGKALNLKRFRSMGLQVGYGISRERMYPSDSPIYLQQQTPFIDPVNGVVKTTFCGNWVPVSKCLDLICVVYGHYFFNQKQLISKLAEYNHIYQVRFAKRGLMSRNALKKQFEISGGNCILPKEIELNKAHPLEIKKVIEQFYRPDMQGNIDSAATEPFGCFVRRFQQGIKTVSLHLKSFPSVQKMQQWYPLEAHVVPPLDIKKLYQKQDRYLPHEARINWDIPPTAGKEQ